MCCCHFFFSHCGFITENAREGLMNQILYADGLVLMSESKTGFAKEVFEMERRI